MRADRKRTPTKAAFLALSSIALILLLAAIATHAIEEDSRSGASRRLSQLAESMAAIVGLELGGAETVLLQAAWRYGSSGGPGYGPDGRRPLNRSTDSISKHLTRRSGVEFGGSLGLDGTERIISGQDQLPPCPAAKLELERLRNHQGNETRFSAPMDCGGKDTILLSRRVVSPDRQPAGMVYVGVPSASLLPMLERAADSAGTVAALVRIDGTVLLSWPEYRARRVTPGVGRIESLSEWVELEHSSKAPVVRADTDSVLRKVKNVTGYNLNLVAEVDMESVTDGARTMVFTIWLLAFAAVGCGIAFFAWFAVREWGQRQLMAEAEAQQREADSSNRAKSEFLAIASHEIRTSMSGVLGMAEFMMKSPVHKDVREGAKIIFDSGQNLVQIINQLLDISKLEAGELQLACAPFDLADLVKRVGDLFSKEAQNKGLELTVDTVGAAKLWIQGDELRIRQVLANLVGNAIKFTKAGGVTIELRADFIAESDPPRLAIELGVSDTGVGIDADSQRHMYQMFSQTSATVARGYGGNGLGLAICKQLVDMMGGSICVASKPGHGASFLIKIECDAAMPPCATQRKSVVEMLPGRSRGEGRAVLLVEDDRANQAIAKMFLEAEGYRVTCANDGWEAVDLYQTESFDVVLMDGNMPVVDGYEAAALIRKIEKREHRSRVPIIATTANTLDEEKCIDAGMDAFVAKPYRLSKLVETIDHWITSADQDRDLPQPPRLEQ